MINKYSENMEMVGNGLPPHLKTKKSLIWDMVIFCDMGLHLLPYPCGNEEVVSDFVVSLDNYYMSRQRQQAEGQAVQK